MTCFILCCTGTLLIYTDETEWWGSAALGNTNVRKEILAPDYGSVWCSAVWSGESRIGHLVKVQNSSSSLATIEPGWMIRQKNESFSLKLIYMCGQFDFIFSYYTQMHNIRFENIVKLLYWYWYWSLCRYHRFFRYTIYGHVPEPKPIW